ncbi:MAG TPA: family 1 glycosylhydrolase [Blastocatellia bacterium]|nr:family 1 glycosylhydrolase [Blastocatellia bacterium]
MRVKQFRSVESRPELWGGVECSTVRVRDDYYNQLESSGHNKRIEDLDLFAGLGIRAIRYPVLWEQVAPTETGEPDWSWADARLARLRELRLVPIVGLVHHGSGPRYTSLIDPRFPEKLATFAASVARRYPWVRSYTPINEPLTTARFSGLYGHWYPHGQDALTFARGLLTQCKAVALAMRAIREVNPTAQLIQTEDLGKCFSTPRLSYQADFENERRWLSFDLLSGRVTEDHPLWDYLKQLGISKGELGWFAENPCPPTVMGINYYITSERFLDERLDRYPNATHGGNGKHRYADVEAVRVLAEGLAGPRRLLQEAWDRYKLPLAITEAHLGCTREEQLRWLKEVWTAACELKESGVDLRAVTVWSLLGSYDWNQLLTCANGHYEPGAFDLRGPRPRPTALARMARDLVTRGAHDHPLLEAPGWWHRLDRLHYLPNPERPYSHTSERPRRDMRRGAARPLVITGATGTLGYAFARICHFRGIPYRLLTRKEMDIAERDSVEAIMSGLNPWAVVNAAGYVRVDQAEQEASACYRENTYGPEILAAACARHGAQLLTFSSDLVFDGSKREPYVESDPVAPLNVYGKSKAEAEQRVLEVLPSSLVIRTSAFFGPWDEYNFVSVALSTISGGRKFTAADDVFVSPTYVPDLVHASLDLLIDGERGIWHLANSGQATWAELARTVAKMHDLEPSLVEGQPTRSLGLAAPRPLYGVLASERGHLLPSLGDALSRYSGERWNPSVRMKTSLYKGAR